MRSIFQVIAKQILTVSSGFIWQPVLRNEGNVTQLIFSDQTEDWGYVWTVYKFCPCDLTVLSEIT